jgi:Phage Tail Collar Domain
MKESVAAIITGIATLLAALLATQDGRLILARIFKPKRPEGALGQRSNPIFRFFLVFLVGAGTGGFLFFLTVKEAGQVPYIGGYKMPVGTVVAYLGKVAPDGWLLCDGKDIPAPYKELIVLVGEKTPDMKGRFLRGIDPTGTNDPDGARAIGSVQEDEFKSHSHSNVLSVTGKLGAYSGNISPIANQFNFESAEAGGKETRPKNVAVNFIIKY